MRENYIAHGVSDALRLLCRAVLDDGDIAGSRGGKTKELTHVGVTLENPLDRYVLIGHRRASLPAQIAETMMVLSGRNDVPWLSNYLKRAPDFSDDGKTWRAGYGTRLRSWRDRRPGHPIDQLEAVVLRLREDPETRQAVMSIWDPALDNAGDTKDIPCNNWLHFLARDGQLDLHVATRSNDLIWGWSGINAFEWSVLLELVAALTNLDVGQLHFSISSLHIYETHWQRARRVADVMFPGSSAYDAPRLTGVDSVRRWDVLCEEWFRMEKDIRDGNTDHDAIAKFPCDLLREWLLVLDCHWNGWATGQLSGALRAAYELSVRRVAQPESEPEHQHDDECLVDCTDFNTYVSQLHATKHAAYGDSWRRRGEMIGILANIARKVDRLGKTDELETAADTAIDLLVYLLKYRGWIVAKDEELVLDEVADVDNRLRALPATWHHDTSAGEREAWLTERFELLHHAVARGEADACKLSILDTLIAVANAYARSLYWQAGNATRSWNPEA